MKYIFFLLTLASCVKTTEKSIAVHQDSRVTIAPSVAVSCDTCYTADSIKIICSGFTPGKDVACERYINGQLTFNFFAGTVDDNGNINIRYGWYLPYGNHVVKVYQYKNRSWKYLMGEVSFVTQP